MPLSFHSCTVCAKHASVAYQSQRLGSDPKRTWCLFIPAGGFAPVIGLQEYPRVIRSLWRMAILWYLHTPFQAIGPAALARY